MAILAISFYIFSTMGAEFVPTLDEGDFIIQPVLKTGTSLKKVVETTTKIEKILKKFPEVKTSCKPYWCCRSTNRSNVYGTS